MKTTRKNLPSRAKKNAAQPLRVRGTQIYIFRLFIAGATTRSREAVLRVRGLCKSGLEGNFKLEVIDIYQQPQLACKNQIVATPTLIIECPPPLRRFIGNLTNITGLCTELDLVARGKIIL